MRIGKETIKMVYCKDCEYKYGSLHCIRNVKVNPFTECLDGIPYDRGANIYGSCPYFKKKRSLIAKLLGR